MKDLKFYLESLLDDEDDLATDFTKEIEDFLANTYYCERGSLDVPAKFKIERDSDGDYVVTPEERVLHVAGDATRLTNGLFRFSPKLDKLSCYYCLKLESLEGCPVECKQVDCYRCVSLKNLVGAPKVCEKFICTECKNLESLEGAPQKCGTFQCDNCPKLKTLVDAPKVCDNFDCGNCNNLKDLTGAPQKCKVFSCNRCEKLTSLKGISKNVKSIYCLNCWNLSTLKHIGPKVENLYVSDIISLRKEFDELSKTVKNLRHSY